MLKKSSLIIAILFSIVILFGCISQSSVVTNNTQLPNPASENCIKNGGTLSIISQPSGELGICTLKDGTKCEEWAYYKGECPIKTGPVSDEILIKVISSQDAKIALEKGEMDYYLSPLDYSTDVLEIKSEQNTKIKLYPATSTIMGIYFNGAPSNSSLNPLSNSEVRFALNFLINREKIVQEVYNGEAFSIIMSPWPGHPSYNSISATVDSFNITYNKQKGMAMLNQSMSNLGAVLINNTWHYQNSPIELVMPIYNGSDGRADMRAMSEIVAEEMQSAGFTVRKEMFNDYSEATYYSTDPKEMKWHIAVSGSIFYGASKYHSANTLSPAYEDGWWRYDNPKATIAQKMMQNASSQAEWNNANSQLAKLYIEDSIGIWLVALNSSFGARKEIQGIVDDQFVGIISYGTARQTSDPTKKSLIIGAPYLYEKNASWNPVIVEHIYMMDLLNTIHDPAKTADPKTLEELPFRLGFHIERYSSPQNIPSDSFNWNPIEKKWVSADLKAVSKVTYDFSGYIDSKWHNGQKINGADVIYLIASTSDRLYDSEKQKIASDQFREYLDQVVGYRVNGSKLEVYMNTRSVDDSEMLSFSKIFQRIAPFEIYAANDKLVFADKKYTYGGINSNLASLSLVEKDHVADVLNSMESLTYSQISPMVTLGDKNYLEKGVLEARLQADKDWNKAHGHLIISDGAFYMDYYNPIDGSVKLVAFRDPDYPFVAGKRIAN